MTATDELRRMLDERGVKWDERGVKWDELVGHPVVVGTEWHDRDGYSCAALEHAYDVPDGMLSVQANLTPAQAIEATLGRGTCSNLAGQDEYGEWGFCCSECGARPKYDSGEVHLPSSGELPDGTVWLGDSWVPWRYCPNCGRRVVGA